MGRLSLVTRALFAKFLEAIESRSIGNDTCRLDATIEACIDQALFDPEKAELALCLLPLCLERVSDADPDIREAAASNMAALIRLVSLCTPSTDAAAAASPSQSDIISEYQQRQRSFLGQLSDPRRAEPVDPHLLSAVLNPESIRCARESDHGETAIPALRPYQVAGISWLLFLHRHGLHGALCDDMGLGKTLQTLSAIALTANDSGSACSLVVCPGTLVWHWREQCGHFIRPGVMQAWPYVGPNRHLPKKEESTHTLIVTSYEVLRSDHGRLRLHCPSLHYLVLDESHLIRNAATRTAQACKSLPAKHRLALSGTPIQNNVVDLWSLMDFLMPGMLGSQQSFSEKFAKPILAARLDPSIILLASSGATSDAPSPSLGAEDKLRTLHRLVLPFILRRMKEDVLPDLPPKIIQDFYPEATLLQRRLFAQLLTCTPSTGASASSADSHVGPDKKRGSLERAVLMRKIATHPSLAPPEMLAPPTVPEDDLGESPKLALLRELLESLGCPSEVPPNRVLVFVQQRSSLDACERLVLKPAGISFLRLDGASNCRHETCQAFNRDPSIAVLLLTTHVGGLGLTLTAANYVIFLEPDWNPQRDLQAMDRAHRLGQTRTVTVYRLLLRGCPLEERIARLQKLKLYEASTVVNQQNAIMSLVTKQDDNDEADAFGLFDTLFEARDVKDNGTAAAFDSEQDLGGW